MTALVNNMTSLVNSKMYEKLVDIFNKMGESYAPSNIVSDDDVSRWIQVSETEQLSIEKEGNVVFNDDMFDLPSNVINSIPKTMHNEYDISMFINEFTAQASNITMHTVSNNIT